MISNLFQKERNLFFDLIEPFLAKINRLVIHFVAADDDRLDSEGICKKGMLSRLPFFRNPSLKLSKTTSNNQDSTVRLNDSGNSVVNEVPMPRSVDQCVLPFLSLNLILIHIYCYASFPLSLCFIYEPGIFERCFSHLFRFVFYLLHDCIFHSFSQVHKVAR